MIRNREAVSWSSLATSRVRKGGPFMRMLASVLAIVILSSGTGIGANAVAEGEQWLKWSDETKLEYASAYVQGFDSGVFQACKQAEKMWQPKSTELPGKKCRQQMPGHTKKIEYYVSTITDYYHSYPEDQYVTIGTLIDGLSDARNLTIQQMHRYYGSSPKKAQ
jgi:hypothetical protein